MKEAGAGVTDLQDGDRVYTSQPSAEPTPEQALCNGLNVHPLPGNVSFEQGAGVGVPYGAAYRALFQRAGAHAAETVLVHGASGGVGIAAVQLARAAGLTVFGTAGSDTGMELAKREGAHHVLNHAKEGYLDELMKLTQGQGVNIILEMLAEQKSG